MFKINRLDINNTKNYVQEVNKIFNQRILHYWDKENWKKYHITLPLYENYILYFLTHTLYRQNALRYEFCNYEKTLERGVGVCSQAATALADFFNKQGIHTNVIAWPLHVITEVEVEPGVWWTVDPDYGVTIPYSIEDINKQPSLIEPFFRQAGYSNEMIEKVLQTYSYPDKTKFPYNGPGYANCNSIRKKVEDWSYVFIWLIPLLLITPLAFQKIKKLYVSQKK